MVPRNSGPKPDATSGRYNQDVVNSYFGTGILSFDWANGVSQSSPARSQRPTIYQPRIKQESDSEKDVDIKPKVMRGDPDLSWIKEWESLDVKSAIRSQIIFFKSLPRFDAAGSEYVLFFTAIWSTICAATIDPSPITGDVVAMEKLRILSEHFEVFVDQCEPLLRYELDRIKANDPGQCETLEGFQSAFNNRSIFLSRAKTLALYLDLWKEWKAAEEQLRAAKERWLIAREQEFFDMDQAGMLHVEPPELPLSMDGPLSPELLQMDYEFTDNIWCQWVESCIAYFDTWTANPTRKVPAKDFIRHLSHYRLAMEMIIRHKATPDDRISRLLTVATKYMRQYSHYTALKLERDYEKMMEDAASSGIYLTEAAFYHLADDIEVIVNESPPDIPSSVWDSHVASIMPRHTALKGKNAVSLRYKEFQIQRYPEDEVSYLWGLTWRNLKYVLAKIMNSDDLHVTRQGMKGVPVTMEARDLTMSFVEQHLSRMLSIVEKDNDALHQKDIERLIKDYCAYIDDYVQAEGEIHDRVYPQFASLSRTKPVPFAFLVSLEEALLKDSAEPSNGSQMISHRVVKRLNHIMEGPKAFNRWAETTNGDITVYCATNTSLDEQAASLEKQGFRLGETDRPGSSPVAKGPLPSLAAGAGDDGSDDGDEGDKRGAACSDEEGSSSSSDEVEEDEASPGGIAHKTKPSTTKKTPSPVAPETLTKGKVDWLLDRTKRSHGAAGPSAGLSSEQDDELIDDEDGDAMSRLPPPRPSSSDYHRRRLEALRTEQRSAVPNAQYPLPETAASQRALALQIDREMADPGMLTEGPDPGDVQPYIDPALRLPQSQGHEQDATPGSSSIRDTLRSIRGIFNRPPLTVSPAHSRRPVRPTPSIPESDAQRARIERTSQERASSGVRRQPDKFSISKSPRHSRRARSSSGGTTSNTGSDNSTPNPDSIPPRSGQGRGVSGLGFERTSDESTEMASTSRGGSVRSSSRESKKENRPPSTGSSIYHSNQENQTPSRSSSANNSNKENQSPRGISDQESQDSNPWDSPSPPRQRDNNIYLRSPMRDHGTPTPHGPRHPREHTSRHVALGGQDEGNFNADRGRLSWETGVRNEGRRYNEWIDREMDSGNQAMQRAINIDVLLRRNHDNATLVRLYELLRFQVETTVFHDYVFERETAFGNHVRPAVSHDVPDTVRELNMQPARSRRSRGSGAMPRPSTPTAQVSRHSQDWWNDPFEGTRQGLQRSAAAAWADPPTDLEGGQSLRHGHNHYSQDVQVTTDSHSNSHLLGADGNPPQQRANENGNSQAAENAPRRAWSWRPNATTGLPEREYDVHIGPGDQEIAATSGVGRPIVVQDPLNPRQMTTNPDFGPEILSLIGDWRVDERGQINIRVPQGWRVAVESTAVSDDRRSMAPSPPGNGHDHVRRPSREQVEAGLLAPTHGGSSSRRPRGRSSAPPSLGLLSTWPQRQEQQSSFGNVHGQGQGFAPQHRQQQRERSGDREIRETPSGSDHQVGGNSPGNSGSSPEERNRQNKLPKATPEPSASTPQPRPTMTTAGPSAGGTRSTMPETLRREAPTPWYLAWNSSTVVRLREELRRRGIPLAGLKNKQQMIDRLRQDDAEQVAEGEGRHSSDNSHERQQEQQLWQDQIEDDGPVIAETQPEPQQQQQAAGLRQEVGDTDDSSDSDRALQMQSDRRLTRSQSRNQAQSQSQDQNGSQDEDQSESTNKRKRKGKGVKGNTRSIPDTQESISDSDEYGDDGGGGSGGAGGDDGVAGRVRKRRRGGG